MRPHLHLLGILQLVWGGIGLLLGTALLLLGIGAVAIGIASSDERIAAGVTAGAFALGGVALLGTGALNAWAGLSIGRLEPRGRTTVLGLGALNLFLLPFGTALSLYGYWVLLHNETRRAFLRPAN